MSAVHREEAGQLSVCFLCDTAQMWMGDRGGLLKCQLSRKKQGALERKLFFLEKGESYFPFADALFHFPWIFRLL